MRNDGLLSQDEIDALLNGDSQENDANQENLNTSDYLTAMEQDAIGEIGNISFSSSATALSQLLNQKVEITTPNVSVVFKNKLAEEFPQPYVVVQVEYTQGFSGINVLIIQESDAAIIADLMLGGNGQASGEIGEIQLSAVQEAMNQMMGSAATSMSTIFHKRVDISPPSIDFLFLPEGRGKETFPPEDILVKVSFRLKIGELIDSTIMQVLPLDFAKKLVEELMNPSQEQNMESVDAYKKEETPIYESKESQVESPLLKQEPMMNPTGSQAQTTVNVNRSAQTNVQPAVFSNFEQVPVQSETDTKNLDILLDIPLQVTVELGKTKRSVKEILELSSGSIVELDKLAGEPVDILVNNRLIAKGEVVVIEENFGVRVTDIVSQKDRLKKLK